MRHSKSLYTCELHREPWLNDLCDEYSLPYLTEEKLSEMFYRALRVEKLEVDIKRITKEEIMTVLVNYHRRGWL